MENKELSYEMFVGSRNDGSDKIRVLFVITDAGSLPSEAIFDSHSDVHSFTNGRGYFHAFTNVISVDDVPALEEQFRAGLLGFIHEQEDKTAKVARKRNRLDLSAPPTTE